MSLRYAPIAYELGVLRVDAGGSVKWAVDTDVVENSRIDAQGNLVLTVMGQCAEVVVSMESGRT